MDAIESLDWGAYLNFGFTVNNRPEILTLFKGAYHLGSHAATTGIALVAALVLVRQRKVGAAVISLLCFAVAAGVVEAVRLVVPRHRPEDAEKFLGSGDLLGSYPSAGVLLFMLSATLLARALWGVAPRISTRCLIVLAATLLTVWVCLSHLYLRIHFVTDVIGALAGGALFGWIGCRLIGMSIVARPPDPPLAA